MSDTITSPHEMEESFITGTAVHIIFRNEENGYSVVLVRVKDSFPKLEAKKVTVVGYFPAIEKNERYRFEGYFKEHPRFGNQYYVTYYQKEIPTETEALITYLSSDRFPGIGEKTAATLVEKFGKDVISIILDDPEKLTKIPHMNEKRRNQIYEAMMENQGMERAMMSLTRYGFGMELAVKIYQTYREKTLEIIEENPYQLVWDVEGVGFHKADQLGTRMGIEKNNPDRLKAGILYILYEKTLQEGHVYVPREIMVNESLRLLNDRGKSITTEDVKQAMEFLLEEDKIVEEEDRIYMKSLYFAEIGFVSKVRKLLDAKEERTFSEAEFLKALGETEEKFQIQYETQQVEAIRKAIESPFMILTGGPGTGKTTVIRAIVEVYASLEGFSLDRSTYEKEEPFPILLAAPTGRAAKRMKESTGLLATTIHKLLGFNGLDGMEKFERDEENPLQGKLLIVDEVSMVDMWLANQLFRAIPEGMKVVLVGDEDQLPSVGPGQVLRDVLIAQKVPTVTLSVVYRQAEGSSIIQLAHAMKQGSLPSDLKKPFPDRRFFVSTTDNSLDVVVQVCKGALNKGYSPMDIQVLAPIYRGPVGIYRINQELQTLFNPHQDKKRKITVGETIYSTGDVVLQLTNNPDEEVFNGDRGIIKGIIDAKETVEKQTQIVISFDGKEVTYTKKDMNQVMLAYCSSIHKAQGSEFPIVIVPMLMSYRRMLARNLIYTAITRAKDYLILCGEEQAFQFAVDNVQKEERFTTLKERLLGEI
ncbi:ATP-dependent RecD-like DNA helicase [Aliibacillus thermotolerans]|uniref:ATP-dependent RecD2 DNA helicase n=1 Tax=Aliibacillus thermotolerans TaxID=1834418 RepID=A0ABW0U8I9_9BACI|nr:ATP-dependent RecD-like DNA helicase [Aliibacillus thermotolerans]MDA3130800.1 ATP-dependent RecD-like DNA helicase [Aliibacillus thermotolerans]